MNPWRPIDTAPNDQSPVDLWVQHPDGFSARLPNCMRSLLHHKGWFDGNRYIPLDWATHWMPIPKGPDT